MINYQLANLTAVKTPAGFLSGHGSEGEARFTYRRSTSRGRGCLKKELILTDDHAGWSRSRVIARIPLGH